MMTDEKDEIEGLYDLPLPLGIPIDIITEAIDRFDVWSASIEDDDTKPVLRGSLEEVTKAQDYIFKRLKEFIAEKDKKL
ncbi:MAG: hypothetical protein SYNGOMJ08_00182 [Candidatus Syntrophoarchaeum sp. GoM_oil]|nr:MAG: hypothetical protein SYNGOMJ08_00182 [Candidatus Syntrophoarchaeum sp. GoM_oil]